MLSQGDAFACLEAASADLKSLTYDELEELAERQTSVGEEENIELQVAGETAYISTTITKFGRFRKRVSVEMVLSVKGDEGLSRYPIIYFERFQSGRLYPSQRETAREAALFKGVPYALLGVAVIGLLALGWHLFLRGG